ncbi:MAG: thioredoxin fold domain-containing protein [Bacteroidales bacterium]|jgi:thioredoxin|nr:thioredoxin fold domain-containing protein [Bacteroidales bacterium]
MMHNIKINLLSGGLLGLLFLGLTACNPLVKEVETTIETTTEPTATENPSTNTDDKQEISPLIISSAQFIELVSDYRKAWKYKGNKPCVVDFYADWCRPCKAMEPAFAKLAEQYAGKVDFYKVNVDSNEEIASAYYIMGIPALFFCSSDGEPIRVAGYQTEEQIAANIEMIVSK